MRNASQASVGLVVSFLRFVILVLFIAANAGAAAAQNLSLDELTGVNLSDAVLSGTDLGAANLTTANLSGADLTNADLTAYALRSGLVQ